MTLRTGTAVTACLLAALAGCRRAPPAAAPVPVQASVVDAAPPPAQAASFYAQPFSRKPSVPELTDTGRLLFTSPVLSASGRQSCSTCHVPSRAFGPDSDLPVQPGGAAGDLFGVRAVPSLRYLPAVPKFDEHFQDSDGDGTDQGPAGGFTWDGRAQTVHDQARLPLFSEVEMANRSEDELVSRLRASPLAAPLRQTFGADVLDDTARAMRAVLLAFEVYQQDPPTFAPYDSKYDAVLRGKATLDAAEERGLRLFVDPKKGNCAVCHPFRIKDGAFPAFSDYGFVALGVPRNREIAKNRDPAWFDLGLCGPLRTDESGHPEWCGAFRTPSLRNVTLRRRFFHNGRFGTLKEALRFYARRDSEPKLFYPMAKKGAAPRYDDLPAAYQGNVNQDPPFGRKPGDPPALTDAEIDDVIAFLGTLTDGWKPL